MIHGIRRRFRARSAPKPLLAYVCPHCSSDAVSSVALEPLGAARTQVRARCGACGAPWESVMPPAIAAHFEAHVAAGVEAIRRALERFDREPDLERLAAALSRA